MLSRASDTWNTEDLGGAGHLDNQGAVDLTPCACVPQVRLRLEVTDYLLID